MSFNFTGVQSMRIPEGVGTKITDASGRVLWNAIPTDRAVLTVAKQTMTTYAGETQYADEQFVLLDVYPRKGGKVNVTYGGLTKTITDDGTFETPNAQQVFFGTYNGVSDSTETPDSGTLTIEGNFAAYGCGSFSTGKVVGGVKMTNTCSCITGITEWGEMITHIPSRAFYGCRSLTHLSLPSSITSIADEAFRDCYSLVLTSLPSGITTIGDYAFYSCINLNYDDNFLNHGLTEIGTFAFALDQYGTAADDDDDDTKAKAFLGSLAITIPASVTTIGAAAFDGPIIGATSYSYFYRVTVLATNPPTYDESNYTIFSEKYASKNFTIIVPKGCGEAYKSADGWNSYADYIVEVS